jgi:predicted DNA-binding protein (MmcQ/YjbR family)
MTTRSDRALREMRAICLALPEAVETLTWGEPHFRVRNRIFAGCGEKGGRVSIGFKLERENAAEIVKNPRFRPAPYVGKHGWVAMDVGGAVDWREVRELVHESYRLIAPKTLAAKLAAGGARSPRAGSTRPRAG